MDQLTLIKVGGKIVEEEASLRQLLADFAQIAGHKVLVHGGGRSATALAARLGIESRMVNGRRITDADMLRVVTMVYGGLVNKQVVAGLQALGVNALGLTGADMDYMRSAKRPAGEVDYGFVGDVRQVNAALLADLISRGVVPVLAPLTHDGQGHLLNTNADTIAAEAAKALARHFEVTLMFCFAKKRRAGRRAGRPQRHSPPRPRHLQSLRGTRHHTRRHDTQARKRLRSPAGRREARGHYPRRPHSPPGRGNTNNRSG